MSKQSLHRRVGVSPEAGFTLFELLIAVTIIVVMLGFALPQMSAALAAHRVLASTRATVGYLRLVRATAVGRNAPTRLVLNEGGTVLSMQIQRGGAWQAVGSQMPLETGVTLAAAPDPLVFAPQGTAQAATTLTVSGQPGMARQIVVSILGSVDVR